VAEPLKAQFGEAVVRRLAAEIAAVHTPFDARRFQRDALLGFDALELLDRGRHLGSVLHRHLPQDFGAAVDILLATLPATRASEGGMASFFYLPHTEFIREHGVPHFAHSMRALHALTQHFTGEFAVRPFFEHHEAATLAQFDEWTRDESEHVRRLVSEGSRTRLPWAARLRAFQKSPAPVLRLLELLRDDPALYVRRSVANNLNDIGKDNPESLFTTVERWMIDAPAERRWIVQHALRSAVKAGHPRALKVLGYGATSRLAVTASAIAPLRPALGTKVVVSCTVTNSSRKTQQAVIDLRVHFVKASGAANVKVFKLAAVNLAPGESQDLRKTISLADLTTRKHYAGVHLVELQVNGVMTPLGSFTVVRRKT
jgi:3-methyladenine DNA glycosylase AlkC